MTTLTELREEADRLVAQGWTDRRGIANLVRRLIVKMEQDERERDEPPARTSR
jgi:hypothetical protein